MSPLPGEAGPPRASWDRDPRRPLPTDAGDGDVPDTWTVQPSGPLRGDVRVAGSKNAVTKHMVAAILGSTPSVIRNVPDVGDVDITADILTSLGVGVERGDGVVHIDPTGQLG
ncbi:MAG TPA: hypothetical protein VK891_02335, partial [Euzebyales bacterium]|nr:hypothetical protein [Euzebyales bacterium]